MSEVDRIVVTKHGERRAKERAGWSREQLLAELATARHIGVSNDGLEVWRSGTKEDPGPLILVEAHGLAGCRPSRIAIVTVLERSQKTLKAIAAAKSRSDFKPVKGWRRTDPLADLWAKRGARA